MFVDLYFGFGFFFAFLNFYYLIDSRGIIGEPDETSVSQLSSYLLSSIFVRIPYVIWLVLGFLSSQWVLFLFLIAFTGVLFVVYEIIEIEVLKKIILKVSVFVEFVVVGFVCLNYFHIGIDVLNFVL